MVQTPNDVYFAADIMIGRLARWLRILGYNTIYNSSWQSKELVDQAKKENRILLTRSPKLIRENLDLKSYLIKQQNPREQLKTIMIDLKLGTQWIFSRCILCNTKVKSISKEGMLEKVPEHVLKNSEKFYQCPNCEKIYWEGSHRKRFLEFLNRLEIPGIHIIPEG